MKAATYRKHFLRSTHVECKRQLIQQHNHRGVDTRQHQASGGGAARGTAGGSSEEDYDDFLQHLGDDGYSAESESETATSSFRGLSSSPGNVSLSGSFHSSESSSTTGTLADGLHSGGKDNSDGYMSPTDPPTSRSYCDLVQERVDQIRSTFEPGAEPFKVGLCAGAG